LRASAHFSEIGRINASRRRVSGTVTTVAAHSETACWKARLFRADAVILAPVFSTESHPGRPALGVLRVRLMARRLPIPLYVLGGVNAGNARRFAGAGLAGLAAVGVFKE
jgi:thiamine-phosphate pyrophosphorylase